MAYFEHDDLYHILNSIDDGVYITDGKGNVLFVNDKSLGDASIDDVLGRNMRDLIEEGYYNDSIVLKVIEEGKAITMLQHEGCDLLTTAIPYYKDDEIYMIVCCERIIDEIDVLKNRLRESQERNLIYQQELDRLKNMTISQENIIAESSEMKHVLHLGMLAARTGTSVLIEGETGVGKEILAQYIHRSGNRKDKPFITVNCAAIPEELFESEMYGYSPGAFTGAEKSGKKGYFELAHTGVLFLDEIGEISPSFQIKLLRAIQEKEIYRVGGVESIPVDVQIIAATNVDLKLKVSSGEFRSDLYYRLNVFPINIPPLRERQMDIEPFIRYFTNKYNLKYGCSKTISPGAVKLLKKNEWAGNVRELENVVERLLLMSSGTTIETSHVSTLLLDLDVVDPDTEYSSLSEILDEMEKKVFINYLKKYKTSAELEKVFNVSRTTINRKISKHGLRKYLK